MKKGFLIAAILGVLLIIVLSIFAFNPIISCTIDLPETYMEAIKSQAAGVYSNKLPLVPVCVSVDSFSGETVSYTIFYFPFGTLGMEYKENDGYNIEKPLFPGA